MQFMQFSRLHELHAPPTTVLLDELPEEAMMWTAIVNLLIMLGHQTWLPGAIALVRASAALVQLAITVHQGVRWWKRRHRG
jgi:hypothetical protein